MVANLSLLIWVMAVYHRNMGPRSFILLPIMVYLLLELFLLIKAGEWIGTVWAVFLVVFTSVLGALLLRFQGVLSMRQVQASVARGEMPTIAMIEAMILMFCGVMLLLPGFISDFFGLLGLVGPLRRHVIRKYLDRLRPPGGPGGPFDSGKPSDPNVIEGEFRRED